MQQASDNGSILALDVGEARIGVARAGLVARLAEPLVTLSNTPNIFRTIADLCQEHAAQIIVVGLPRGLSGQETVQTEFVEKFVNDLKSEVNAKIYMQDEALTSRQAEAELAKRSQQFQKADIDALAATYILEDYLREQRGNA